MTPKMLTEKMKMNLQVLGFTNPKKLPKLIDIKKQYCVAIKSNHPDKNPNCDETTKKVLEEEFSKIFTAYKNIVNFILENKDNLEDEEE